jgi:hypothetical protein
VHGASAVGGEHDLQRAGVLLVDLALESLAVEVKGVALEDTTVELLLLLPDGARAVDSDVGFAF